jgi:F-type H+-transporting ATPase subunit epsilon
VAKALQLEVVTPERLLVSAAVDEVVVPGSQGEFGVLANHTNFLTTLKPGELRYRIGATWNHLSVHWGYADVSPAGMTVLAETAELAEEIDLARAEVAAQGAERQLGAAKSIDEAETARLRLERALLRIRVSKKRRT